MIHKIKQCALLYLADPGFMILSTLGFLSLCAIQTLVYFGIKKNLWVEPMLGVTLGEGKQLELVMNRYVFGDDLLTIIFLLGSCTMFIFGLLIKKQFANDRASLLPGYRLPHITTVLIILTLMISTTILFSKGAMEIAQLFFIDALGTTISLEAIYLAVLIMAAAMLIVGYLSIVYLIVAAYIALMIFGNNLVGILTFFSTNSAGYATGLTILILAFILFIYRLLTLKNEHLEFPFILTWPPQKILRNQMAFQGLFAKIKLSDHEIPPYFQLQGTWRRANHWRYAEESRIFTLIALSIIGLPCYYLFLKSSWAQYLLIAKIENNFLLFAGAPVLLTLITNYKSMLYWNYDLLKPVSRYDFLKQQGIKLMIDLFVFWLIIASYFAVIPYVIGLNEHVLQPKSWMFLFLTFIFTLLNMTWLAALSANENSRAVIINGFFLCLLIMMEFLLAGRSSLGWLAVNAGLCLITSVLFGKLAFEKWMEKEF